MPVRVLFAKHIQFMEDKLRVPHFFCWPGVNFHDIEKGGGPLRLSIRQRQFPLFFFNEETKTADISIGSACPLDRSQEFLANFFMNQAVYDMVRQWISRRGEFSMSFSFYVNFGGAEIERLATQFDSIFGVDFRTFTTIA
jgi:hypothetical protein